MAKVCRIRTVSLVVAAACFVPALRGQAPPAPAAPVYSDPQVRLKGFEQHQAMEKSSPFKDFKWQFLGPTNISGRVTDVAAVTPRGKSYVIYAATATGGLWKTENEGVTFEPVFEQGITASIGDV